MKRFCALALLLLVPAYSTAQEAKFRWQPGQVLTYRVQQVSTATETVAGKPAVTETKLELVKKWQVVAVDPAGVATLSMSLDRLRMETKSPRGDTTLFDSMAKDKSTPALAEELTKYVGSPLTIVRVDGRGQLVEVKESKFGPASRLEADLPFKFTLPAAPLAAGQTWERKYQVKLEPPQGAGETYPAVQKMTCKSVQGNLATIGIVTTVTGPVENQIEQIPLLPLQPAGELVFDLGTGRLKAVKYQWSKEIPGTQGENSTYVFASTYVEELQ